METRTSLTKKALSLFLSVLMAFSCFSVAMPSLVTDVFAAGAYTAQQVKDLLIAASSKLDGGATTSANMVTWSGTMEVVEAVQAVYDYAINTYATFSNSKDEANSSGSRIAERLISDLGINNNQGAMDIVRYTLNPGAYAAGSTTVYNFNDSGTKHEGTLSGTGDSGDRGDELSSGAYGKVSWDDSDYKVTETEFSHIFSAELSASALEAYLLSFNSVDALPKKFVTKVTFTYTYSSNRYGIYGKSDGSGCDSGLRTYQAWKWNYLSDADVRINNKDTKTKKNISNFVKYFTPEVLALTFDEMLLMPAEDLYNLYLVAQGKVDAAKGSNLSDKVLDHFLQTDAGCTYAEVQKYIADLDKAYLIVLGKNSIDVLFNDIDTDYSEMSYAEMSALYGSVSTAYDVVVGINAGILEFILTNYPEYVSRYNSVKAALADAADYISQLYKAMRIQHIREIRENMLDMYEEYYDIAADTNNLEDIDTTQLTAIKDKAEGINSTLDNYTAAEKAEVFLDGEMSAWLDFCDKLEAKLAVRDDEAEYDSFFDYFMPYLFQDYVDMSNEELMDLHANASAELTRLTTIYGEFVTKYGKEWTDALFTVTYNGETGLLHNLVNNNYAASNSALATFMKAINATQLATIAAIPSDLTINFSNYADLRTTLKHFDDDFYSYVRDNIGVSDSDTATYNRIAGLLASWKLFVGSSGESAFDKNFTYAGANGIYAERPAGNQIIEVPDGEGGTNEVQIGYPNDIARDEEDKNGDGIADDNYTVTEDEVEETITKIDNFITSRDFATLIGLRDLTSSLGDIGLTIDEEEAENIVDLPSFVNILFEEAFSDDILNTLVGLIFPMLTDLINTELKNVIRDLGEPEPQWGNASGAYSMTGDDMIGSKWAGVEGVINIFLDQDVHDHDDGAGEELYKLQNEFPQVFADLGLYIYPSTMAQFLADADPITYGPNTEFHKTLKAAGRDWSLLVAKDDPETKEDETKKLDLEWGVYDFDSFKDVLGMVFDTILPVLQTALGNVGFEETAQNAAFIYGKPKIYLLQIGTSHGLAALGELTLTIEPLQLYNKVLVPLFETLGVTDRGYVLPKLEGEFEGADVVAAIFDTVRALLDQIIEAPLTTILEMLPNLIYFLSMDTVSEIIEQAKIHLNLNVSDVDIKTDMSGAVGDIASLFEGSLGGLIEFPLDLDLGELLDLDSMLDFNLTDLNDIIQTLVGDKMDLPRLDQTTIMFSADWVNTKSANGSDRVNLVANKVDVLYAILSYAVSAIGTEGFLAGLLGDDMDPALQQLLMQVVSNINMKEDGMDGAIAAIMEILVPNTDANGEPEYELEDMDWVESQWNYGDSDGLAQMDIVYLNYGNDWTKDTSNYIIKNSDKLVSAILEMTDSDIENLGTYLTDALNGVITGDIITTLVETFGGFGDSPSAVINDIISEQVGVDITVWFDAFGYLFPAETWKDDAVIIAPGQNGYETTFANVTGSADAEGNITWYYKGEAFVDGDIETFINILCDLLAEFDVAVGLLLGGWDVTAFDSLLEIKGYESYATTFGVLFETLGVEGIATQDEINAAPIEGLRKTLLAVAAWLDKLTSSETMIETLLEAIPDLFYYIESNGLSTLLHNLLMPIWVIVDDLRPILDVNINGVISLIVSDLLNYGEIDLNRVLQYLGGVAVADDLDYKYFNIDINHLTLSEILRFVDGFFGTDLYNSGLVQIGIRGLCSGIEEYASVTGTGYKTTVDAADTLTIIITAFIDCLSYPSQIKGKTNGDVIFEFIAEKTGNENIAGMYSMITELLLGIEVEYESPNWGYMFDEDETFTLTLPTPTIAYLDYSTDWTEDTAKDVYSALEPIVSMVLADQLEEGESIATLLNGILEDEVYTDEILNTLVELIVNALASLDKTLFELVDVVVDTNIAAWFDFCTYNEETEEYECTEDWGIAEAEDKKTAFITALQKVLAPANELLSWLFFADSYAFFTGSEKDAEGNYTYNDLLTLNGGEGYAYGLAPILEALGCELRPASDFYNEETKTYDVGAAIGGILESVLALVDKISADPVKEVFSLIPNLIYFINADGLKTSVNNLLAPVDAIIEKLSPVINDDGTEASLGSMLEETIGFNISEISMDTLLKIAEDNEFVISEEIVFILKGLYVGNLVAINAANKMPAYRLDVTGAEHDVLTIILSLALDLFNLNEKLFSDLLPDGAYAAIKALIAGLEMEYIGINWAYMYEDIEGGATALEQLQSEGFPYQSITYLDYSTDWTEDTAKGVYDGLLPILNMVLADQLEEGESLATLLSGILNDEVYKDDVLNSVVELLVNAIAGFDADIMAIVGAADSLLGADINDWFTMCTFNEETEEYECTKNWGIDAAADADKKDMFIAGIKEVLAPANDLLAWLFFGDSFTFFKGTTSENEDGILITLNGGEGYAKGLAPILEALGLTLPAADTFKDANGKYNVGNAIEAILNSVLAFVDEVSADPVKAVFELLPNLIYFINADGVKASVNNLIAPATVVLDCLAPVLGEDMDVKALLVEQIGFDIFDISMDTLLQLAADNDVILTYEDEEKSVDLTETLKKLFVGTPVAFDSASGEKAYRIDITGREYDILTIILSLAIDVFNLNEKLFADLLPEGAHPAIKALIAGLTVSNYYIDINWAYMYEDIEGGATALEQLQSEGFPYQSIKYLDYISTDWTEETAKGVYDGLLPILNMVLADQLEEGESLATLLDGILNDEVYKDDVLNSVVELVVNAIAGLDENIMAIIGAADSLLGADINAWIAMCTFNEETGEYECTKEWGIENATDKKQAFVDGLKEVLTPANDLLAWLLFGGSFSFFNGETNEVLITLNGGEGYAKGLAPILEALGVTLEPVENFKDANGKYNVGDAIESLLNSLLAFVDEVSKDPVAAVFSLLPNLIYFINADGLKASVNNLLAPVTAVLECLAPVTDGMNIGTLLEEQIGFNIYDISMDTLLEFAADYGVVLTDEEKGIDLANTVKNLFVGEPETFTSASGKTAYRINIEGREYDILTILLSLALDVFNLNGGLFEDLLPGDAYNAIKAVLAGIQIEYVDINWAYMYDGEDALDKLANDGFPKQAIEYLAYSTNWTKATAQDVYSALKPIVSMLLADQLEEGESLATLLNGILEDEVYTEDVLNSVVELLVNAIAGFDEDLMQIVGAVDSLLSADINAWFTFCELNEETGEYECNYDWGFETEDGRTPKEKFVDGIKAVLAPANDLLAWVFFGDSFTFFTGETNAPLITINGGHGYAYGLAPILEALGVTLQPSANFKNAETGKYDVGAAIAAMLDSVLAFVDEVSADPVKEVFELLPNLIYFINADGVKASVNNLLAPVNAVLAALKDLTGDISIGSLLEESIGFDICNISMDTLLQIAADNDVILTEDIVNIIKNLFIGVPETFDSASTREAFRINLEGHEHDMLTILLSLALDVFNLNENLFADLLPDGAYTAIKALLAGLEVSKYYIDANWAYMYEGEDALEKLETEGFPHQSIKYLDYFSTDWTVDTAKGVYDGLLPILNMVLADQLEEGESLATLLDGILNDEVYKDDVLNSVVELIVNAIAGLDENIMAIIGAADSILGADINAWFNICEFNEETDEYECTKNWGIEEATDKKQAFVDGLKEVLAPANDLLAWLLFGGSFTFFNGTTNEVLITLNGGHGYAMGLAPILEALGVTLAPVDNFFDAETGKYNVGDAIESLLNSLLAFVDEVSADPVAAVFSLLPNLIYFINADGLKASVNNLLAPVTAVLECLAPVTDGMNIGTLLEEQIGFNIYDISMDTLLKFAADYGVVLTDEENDIDLAETLKNLFVGEPEAFTSASGKTAYRINIDGREYDILTIVLSLALDVFNLNGELFADLLPGDAYNAIKAVLAGIQIEYVDINWAYMYEGEKNPVAKLKEGFPAQSIAYLEYITDWTETKARSVYDGLGAIADLALESLLEEGESLATLLNGILEDEVYTEDVLNSVVELLVNAIAGFDDDLRQIIGAVDSLLSADINAWFTFCEFNEETGEYECNYDWGFDEVTDENTKKDAFINGIKAVLAPANDLLAWVFFGDSFTFFTGETNAPLITINGGHGYAYGLAPILEALGITLPKADTFKDAEGKYNVGNAIEAILDAALAFVDEVSADPVKEVFELLPNLIYFINADGVKASVNNLLAPVNAVLAALKDLTGDISIGSLLEESIGFDICNISMDTLLQIAADNDVVIDEKIVNIIKNLFVGTPVVFDSASNREAFRIDITDHEYDILTIILSLALDVFKTNEALFAGLLDKDTYDAVLKLMKGFEGDFAYINLDWGYMYDGETLADRLEQLVANNVPARVPGDLFSNYTLYSNNWSQKTHDELNASLEALVDAVMVLVMGADADLGAFLESAIADGLYQDSILNSLIEMVVELLVDYEEIVASAGALIGAEGLAVWFDEYCEITTDENGETVVTCIKDWGIDAATTNEAKRAAFVEAFVEVLRPTYELLDWLLFGNDFEFFVSAIEEGAQITIKGGMGYDYALVPLFEALGVTLEPSSEFETMEDAVRSLFTALTDWLAYVCTGLNAEGEVETHTVTEVFDLIPNLLYFINAGGLKVVVNNLLAPVQFILATLKPMGVEVDFATIIEGIDLTNLDLNAVFPILEDELGIVVPAEIQDFLANFYIGEAEAYESANGETAYRLVYTEEETRIDLITVLISVVLDVFTAEENAETVKELLGEDVYTVLMKYLTNKGLTDVPVQEFDWAFVEYADTDKIFSPISGNASLYSYFYGDLYTREKAEYINKWFPDFVDTLLVLLGVQIGGSNVTGLEDLLNNLIGSSVYTSDLLNTIVEALSGLVDQLKELLGEELFVQAAKILDASLGVNVALWDGYVVPDGVDTREEFVNELGKILAPANPLLEWLFTEKELAFFNNGEGGDYVVIEGADGYAYGIIPVLEALGCDPADILTPEQYAADPDGLLTNILNPILNKVEKILEDPVNEVIALLPRLIYFINSNGLDTVIKNALRAVFTVLENIKPLAEVDLYELIGIDFKEYASFDALVEMLLNSLAEDIDFDLSAVAMDALQELTLGKIVSFTSKNGDTAYTMVYTSGADQTDFITTILRLVLTFVSIPENVKAIEALLADSLSGEGYIFLCSLLDNFSQMLASTDGSDKNGDGEPDSLADGMDAVLYTIYQIFYTANVAVHETEDLLGEFNDDYSFLGDLFRNSELSFIRNIGNSLGSLLDKYTEDIIDSDSVAPNGLIRFFQKIAEFFRKIGEFFRNLFS